MREAVLDSREVFYAGMMISVKRSNGVKSAMLLSGGKKGNRKRRKKGPEEEMTLGEKSQGIHGGGAGEKGHLRGGRLIFVYLPQKSQ